MPSKVAYGVGCALLLSPVAALLLLHQAPGLDGLWMARGVHFWAVGGAALFSAVACILIVLSARSLRETRLLFLALAFISIAGVFSIHGLMTRGYIAHTFHSSVSVSPWASTLAGGVFVALSAATLPARIERIVRRAGVAIFAWTVVAVAAFVALSFASRDWLDWAPTDGTKTQYGLALVSTALYAFAISRYLQAFQFARLPSQAAMVACLTLLAQVPAIILWGQAWHLSWWIYHALYGAAFIVLFAGWAFEVRRARSLKVIAEGLSMREALAQLSRGHDSHLLELVDAIEAKDISTLGHVRRVGAYSLAIGRKLGLPASELRSLALAGEMHDVGKIGVPDHILGKPGPLTADEFVEMQRHTGRGHDIALRTKALRELAPVIRAHHERLNGRGYPDGLTADEIPLFAKIIAVADSYDAMTSHRPYRAAMSRDEAVAELRRVRGIELDARCIDALLASFEDEHAIAA
jgi:HD-GYP domain-containing protein (c-di-GMP phosphodiesterase class II)